MKRRALYPSVKARRTGHLDAEGGHEIYFEESGNPNGVPAIFLHGGPGGGCTPAHRRFFDPERYRVILFDQRGCGRSRPHAAVTENTTQRLIDDIELIRRDCNIDRWQVFGGSWGSTLALAYAIAHPDRVTSLVLRGIFLFRPNDLNWFFRDGTPRLYPDAWDRFLNFLPVEDRAEPLMAYHVILHGDGPRQKEAAKSWTAWEFSALSIGSTANVDAHDPKFALAFARIESHYFVNAGFFPTPNYLLENIGRILHIPMVIVHGRHDAICPVSTAFDLARAVPGCNLKIVEDAGHSAFEPGIIHELVTATDEFAKLD